MSPDDEHLVALSSEARHVRTALADMLERDGRDACDIPGYGELADRHAAAAWGLAERRAVGVRGLLAKAMAIDARDAAMRADGAVAIALSLAADVVGVLGPDAGRAAASSSTGIATRCPVDPSRIF